IERTQGKARHAAPLAPNTAPSPGPLQEAMSFGVIGLLGGSGNSTISRSDDPPAPIAPWGRDDAMGSGGGGPPRRGGGGERAGWGSAAWARAAAGQARGRALEQAMAGSAGAIVQRRRPGSGSPRRR